ncbi:Uncharacterised protein [Shewanella putrefaciens]|nr:Uncharacterised protein [Shewanella putrefaciens]
MNDGLANSGAALSRSTQSNAWVPLAQWFAVLTMTLEHVLGLTSQLVSFRKLSHLRASSEN